MAGGKVDYDRLASTYDRRFAGGEQSSIAATLLRIYDELDPRNVLEVGCGTGRWISEIRAYSELTGMKSHCYGLDLSTGMLAKARCRDPKLYLARGRASQLPFPANAFDLVCCINALHHFSHPRDFIVEARRLLQPGGALAVFGMDPRVERCTWYIYRFFEGTRTTDIKRYPAWGNVLEWMIVAGFERISWRQVERYTHTYTGEAVFEDPFLRKEYTSQLILLSDNAYKKGLHKMRQAISEAGSAGETMTFAVDIPMDMLLGRID
jgi:ubiquinone/menaquinone biosynthesis C-methylase UbiE